MADEVDLLDNTIASLKRVAEFDAKSLPREAELGRGLSFRDAVEPAQKSIDLFRKLPPEALNEFPEVQLTAIKNTSDQFFQILSTILNFSPESQANLELKEIK